MIPFYVDYATPSVFESNRDRTILGLTANGRRPVRFHGRIVKDIFLLRVLLRALGETIWSDDTWISTDFFLDPIVTVHPDRIFFEAFSLDQSVYCSLILDPSIFETQGEVVIGTTNVDFTAWLWAALAEMRSNRDTFLRIEPTGFEIRTHKAGGRFEKKVNLPLSWVRGLLNLQLAMGQPGTRLSVRPVDLLSAIRFLRYAKAKVSPRALRYEFKPGRDARIVLEPWEEVIPLKGAEHNYQEMKTIRTWGRRRLRLIEPVLPFADRVDIYLKGRAQPSFYVVKFQRMTLIYGLSGFSGRPWSDSGLAGLTAINDPALSGHLEQTALYLKDNHKISAPALARKLDISLESSLLVLTSLARQGRVILDLETGQYRYRELFESPPEESELYPPDLRLETALKLAAGQEVTVDTCQTRETRKVKRLKTPQGRVQREIIYRDWQVGGRCGLHEVEIVIDDYGRIIFGTCTCEFFRENLLNDGPCPHMTALFLVSTPQRQDKPTSREIEEPD